MRALMVLIIAASAFLNIAEAQNTASTTSAASSNMVLPDKEYSIGATDVVDVFVLKMPELSREYRVSADGVIELPFIGQIKAEDKTSQELAAVIAKSLKGDYLVDPQVSVVVKQVNRR
jgi:protein involved in polysaccharide export with SLBB domain